MEDFYIIHKSQTFRLFDSLIQVGGSFKNFANRCGPRLLSWGTPNPLIAYTYKHINSTLCVRSGRLYRSHYTVISDKPSPLNWCVLVFRFRFRFMCKLLYDNNTCMLSLTLFCDEISSPTAIDDIGHYVLQLLLKKYLPKNRLNCTLLIKFIIHIVTNEKIHLKVHKYTPSVWLTSVAYWAGKKWDAKWRKLKRQLVYTDTRPFFFMQFVLFTEVCFFREDHLKKG